MEPLRNFIELSRKTAQWRKLRVQALVGGLTVAVAVLLTGWLYVQTVVRFYGQTMLWLKEASYRLNDAAGLTVEAERALRQGDPPFKECTRCPKMVVVPAGEFIMGSSDDEKGHREDESPQHKVVISYRFAVAKFELTFEEWDACVDRGDCDPHIDERNMRRRDWDRPAVADWTDAKTYVAWLSRITGKPYRLLSEAEWEYAARAGSLTAYPWGNEIGEGHAKWDKLEDDKRGADPVGQFPANNFGLHDMHGNVAEWVEDCYYHENYNYNQAHSEGSAFKTVPENYNQAPSDGSAWTTANCHGMLRGGSYFSLFPEELRSAARHPPYFDIRPVDTGIRVGRTLLPP
jgi:formylglycine-generating enzyme required for sulfatase activity